MGTCLTKLTEEEIELKRKNKIIEQEIEKLKQLEDDKVKLLLLGAGESGKSTIFKQMKVIYGEKYTDDERKRNIPLITSNIIQSIKQLCEQAVLFNLEEKIEAKVELAIVSELKDNEDCLTEISGNAISVLWKDPGIQEVWVRRSEFHIIESVKYYFDKIDEIKNSIYLPSNNDILMVRVRTSGIVTERYIIDDTVFEMYDVGGQRNERKKWIHCFEGVTAVIFIAALSEYDQQLFEDVSQNRMVIYLF
jgi:GTPase SAR1 family protein